VSSVHGLPSLHADVEPGTHAPPTQPSPIVHTDPSVQASALSTLLQPAATLQESVVHPLSSLQSVAAPGKQEPLLQTSPSVHWLLSLQTAVLSACWQPSAPSQLSSVQGLPSLQFRVPPGTQAPSAHASPTVQFEPSEQASALATLLQPAATLQESVVHALLSLQSVAAPGRQEPPLHASPTVHWLLSEHAFVLAEFTQPAA